VPEDSARARGVESSGAVGGGALSIMAVGPGESGATVRSITLKPRPATPLAGPTQSNRWTFPKPCYYMISLTGVGRSGK